MTMAESPPPSSPPLQPSPSINSDNPTPHNPNPNSPHPQTPEPQNPVDLPNPPEEPQIIPDEPDHDDPEPEQEGMLSPPPQNALESKSNPNANPNPYVSSARRQTKRKRGKGGPWKKIQVALEKKLQTLSQKFNPIPFAPGKSLDFEPHEELLKKLGLWEFAHIEFDRNLRADLIAQLVVKYVPKQRYVHVNGCRVDVNRADLGRALKLPGKRVGDFEGEVFPGEFLVFLEAFVSNWMLLHEDSSIVPSEVVNMIGLIRSGNLEKVDWAGLVWFMVEKELAQGENLKDCYYASHLQRLIKMQREELFRVVEEEKTKVDLTVEDNDEGSGDVVMLDSQGGSKCEVENVEKVDEGGGDVVMLDSEGRPKCEVENVEKVDEGDSAGKVEIGNETEKMDEGKIDKVVENVDGAKKMDDGGDIDKVDEVEEAEKMENVGEKCDDVGIVNEACKGENVGEAGNSEEVCKVENQGSVREDMSVVNEVCGVENVGDVNNVGSAVEVVGEVENVEGAECVDNVGNAEEHVGDVEKADEHVDDVDNAADERVDNVDNADEQVDNVDHADECKESVDNVDEHVDVLDNNTENVEEEEEKDGDMMDFGFCKDDEQGQWLLDGKHESSGQHFLQRCSVSDSKLSLEDERQVGLGEGITIKHEVDEEEEHVEGFRITTQKNPLDGLPQTNLMQAFETGELQYSATDHDGQPSLQLMPSRVESSVMLGSQPTMFNHAGKRELDHEDDIAAHHPLNDNYKKMRIEGSWGHNKPSDLDICIEQMEHWVSKAKIAREAQKEEVYEHGNMSQQYMAQEIARKDNEIMQLKYKLSEAEQRRQAEINRLDRELYLMDSVINGYRSALKDTQRAFSEFRKRCGVPDEPVYRDAGSGGVVKSIAELERERIKQEQERKLICSVLEETYRKHIKRYDSEWESILIKVQSLDARIQRAEDNVKLLKERRVKRTASENTHSEPEDPQQG